VSDDLSQPPGMKQSHQSHLSQQKPTEANEASPSDSIKRAISAAIPQSWSDGPGEKDRPEFQLARELKAIPGIAEAPVKSMRETFLKWFAEASAVMKGKPPEESWHDFGRAWKRVRFPAGQGPLDAAFARAEATDPPPEVMWYAQRGARLLAALCRELQRYLPDQPFFLSCRTAARLLGVDHVTASRWLRVLLQDGVIRTAEAGTKTRATRYYSGSDCTPPAVAAAAPKWKKQPTSTVVVNIEDIMLDGRSSTW
jgi:DNA-binding transcriptional ArsR family regulator